LKERIISFGLFDLLREIGDKMRKIFERKKRGVSNLVGYSLLIVISILIAAYVYSWLGGRFDGVDEISRCPEEVNIVFKDVDCDRRDYLKITLENKGLFTVDGFVIRANYIEDADFGLGTLIDTTEITGLYDGIGMKAGDVILPTDSIGGQSNALSYRLGGGGDVVIESVPRDDISYLEIRPYIFVDGEILCESITKRDVLCHNNLPD